MTGTDIRGVDQAVGVAHSATQHMLGMLQHDMQALVAFAGIAGDGGEHGPEPRHGPGERARLESERGGEPHDINAALRNGRSRGRGNGDGGTGSSGRGGRSDRRSGRASGGHRAPPCHEHTDLHNGGSGDAARGIRAPARKGSELATKESGGGRQGANATQRNAGTAQTPPSHRREREMAHQLLPHSSPRGSPATP